MKRFEKQIETITWKRLLKLQWKRMKSILDITVTNKKRLWWKRGSIMSVQKQ